MRTTAVTIVGLATTGVLLAGCSNGDGGDDKATAAPTTSAAAVPTVPVRDQFLQAINAANINSWEHTGPSDDELAAFPDEWCASLAEGHSVQWMLGEGGQYPIGQTWGTKKADVYRVLVLAVGYYCPERKAAVEEQLRATGDY